MQRDSGRVGSCPVSVPVFFHDLSCLRTDGHFCQYQLPGGRFPLLPPSDQEFYNYVTINGTREPQ